MTTPPVRGQLRAWHIPQVPGKPFFVPVENVSQAGDILEVLATYDVFLLEHNVRPDYASAQGLQVFDPDDEEGGWVEWYSTDGLYIREHIRNGDDLDTLVWDGDV